MPSIVEQIQRDAVDPAIPVSSLLRRVKLAATKLGLPKVEAWVRDELSGYSDRAPTYRLVSGSPMAFSPFNGWIPIVGPIVAQISKRAIGQSVASLEDLLGRTLTSGGIVQMNYPDKISEIVARGTEGVRMTCALHFDRSQLTGILDHVRNLVLDWAIELERTGVVGSEFSFSSEERQRAQEAGVTNIHLTNSGSFVGNLGNGNVARDISAQGITVEFVRDIVQQVRQHQAEIAKAGADAADLENRLSALEQAIGSGSGDGVLRGLLTDLRNTVSGAAGNLVATGVAATLAPYLGAVTG